MPLGRRENSQTAQRLKLRPEWKRSLFPSAGKAAHPLIALIMFSACSNSFIYLESVTCSQWGLGMSSTCQIQLTLSAAKAHRLFGAEDCCRQPQPFTGITSCLCVCVCLFWRVCCRIVSWNIPAVKMFHRLCQRRSCDTFQWLRERKAHSPPVWWHKGQTVD